MEEREYEGVGRFVGRSNISNVLTFCSRGISGWEERIYPRENRGGRDEVGESGCTYVDVSSRSGGGGWIFFTTPC